MKLIKNSQECSKSELDLFYSPPTNTSILSSSYLQAKPANTLNGREESFEITVKGSDAYVDLNDIYLQVEVSVTKSDDSQLMKNTDKVAPINNLGHSLFKMINLNIGKGDLQQYPVEMGNSHYAYKAYFLNLLNYGSEAKTSWLQSGLFYKDEAGLFNEVTLSKNLAVQIKNDSFETTQSKSLNLQTPQLANEGFIKRHDEFAKGKGSLKMIVPLHLDFLHTNKMLINKMSLKFEFERNKSSFLLMGEGFDLNILNASLLVRKCQISDEVKLAHLQALQIHPLCYPIKQNRTIVNSISKDSANFTFSDFSNKIPNKMIFGIVRESAYNGIHTENPFNFQDFGIQSVQLIINETIRTIKINADKNDYIEGYHSLCECLNIYGQNGNNIEKQDYLKGYCLFCFNLSPDKGCEGQYNFLKEGSISAEIIFKENTTESYKLITFLEYDNQVTINNLFEVELDNKF